MVSQIQLGNFFSANGRNVLGGVGGSGLDTQTLIKTLTDARGARATILQDQITLNDKKSAALAEFQTLLSKFKGAVDALRNPPGVDNASENAFRFTNAGVTSNTSVSGSNYLNVSAAPGAALQTYAISEITSLAAARIQTSGTINILNEDAAAVADAPAAGQFKSGTITLRGQNITFNAGDSLRSVAAKFNAVSADTHISANIVKVADGQFRLSFVATSTGTASNFDLNDVYDAMSNPTGILRDPDHVFSTGPVTISNTQAASDAVFTLNDITITRSTNSISDAISGLTFNLLQTTPALTTLSVAVTADTQTARGSIVNFINSYNDIRTFFAKQTQVKDDGTFADTALLSDNQAFRSIVNNVTSQVTSIVSGIGGSNPNRLADLGITFTSIPATTDAPQVTNALNVDEGKLSAALSGNLNGVANVFGFNFSSNNPDLKVFSRTNALGINAFTLTVNPTAVQTIESIDLANADTQVVFTAPDSGKLKAGTVTINGHSVVLADGDTLTQVVQKFNDANAAGSGLAASLTEVTPGHFKVTFTSTPSGSNNNFDLTSLGVDPAGVFGRVTVSATGSYQATYDNGSGPVTVDLDGEAVAGASGYALRGRTGTVLEGIVMVYGSSLSSSINVTASQGIADKIFNISNAALTKDTGTLALELNSIKTKDNRLKDEITKINKQVDDFREQLLLKFGALERTISRVNTLLQGLDAQAAARKNA